MMSRPLPWGMPSMMSMSARSPSSRSASRWARVAPTFPAPTTVTFLFMALCALCWLYLAFSASSAAVYPSKVLDDGARELGRPQHLRPFHLPLEVVGHALLADGALERALDHVRR